jgi:hypothetical protein
VAAKNASVKTINMRSAIGSSEMLVLSSEEHGAYHAGAIRPAVDAAPLTVYAVGRQRGDKNGPKAVKKTAIPAPHLPLLALYSDADALE